MMQKRTFERPGDVGYDTRYYTASDVHGHEKQLREALINAGFFEDEGEHKLVICGDLLDRGPDAKKLVDFMLELLAEGRLIYIKGNHEDLIVQCLQEISHGGVFEIASGMSHHYYNRTWDTLLQLSDMSASEACRHPGELVRRVRSSPFYTKLLPACVDYFETSRFVFTHGWIPCYTKGDKPRISYEYNPKWREASSDEWSLARWHNGINLACRHKVIIPDKTIICGHWHSSYGHSVFNRQGTEWGAHANFAPFVSEGIVAIDACTAVSGFVNCFVVED